MYLIIVVLLSVIIILVFSNSNDNYNNQINNSTSDKAIESINNLGDKTDEVMTNDKENLSTKTQEQSNDILIEENIESTKSIDREPVSPVLVENYTKYF